MGSREELGAQFTEDLLEKHHTAERKAARPRNSQWLLFTKEWEWCNLSQQTVPQLRCLLTTWCFFNFVGLFMETRLMLTVSHKVWGHWSVLRPGNHRWQASPGSMASSGPDGHTDWNKVTQQSCCCPSPAHGSRGCTLCTKLSHPAPAEQPELVPCSALCLAETCPGSELIQPGGAALSPSCVCATTRPVVILLWCFHQDCTVLKSCNSPCRIAPAANKLTIWCSIPTHCLSHVLWPATGRIFQTPTWINR